MRKNRSIRSASFLQFAPAGFCDFKQKQTAPPIHSGAVACPCFYPPLNLPGHIPSRLRAKAQKAFLRTLSCFLMHRPVGHQLRMLPPERFRNVAVPADR